jgi:GT2 family glycosyltransferase
LGKGASAAQRPCELSILIVNWNSYSLLGACLRSIAETVARPHEVIVVDNSQDAGALEALERASGSNVRWLANETNRGFAAANNQAAALARGELLLLLNPDTVVLPTTIDGMVGMMRSQPEIGALGCQLLNRDGSQQTSAYAIYPSLTAALLDATGVLYISRLLAKRMARRRPRVRSVAWLKGACLLVRRALLDAVGGLDDRFFMYGEDADLCYRIRRSGRTVALAPALSIVHLGQGSAGLTNELSLIEYYRSYAWFVEKHQGSGPLNLRAHALTGLLRASAIARMLGTMIAKEGVVGQGSPVAYWRYLTRNRA